MRALLALFTVAGAIVITGVLGLFTSGGRAPAAAPGTATPAATPQVEGSPERTAAAYLRAWEAADYTAMRELTDDPPADFAAQHESFEEALAARSLRLTPGRTVMTGEDTAEVPITESRELPGYGPWAYPSAMRLGIRDQTWKVLWEPAVMHPDLAPGGGLRRTAAATGVPAVRLVTQEGRDFPADSDAEAYLARLSTAIPEPSGGTSVGWRVEMDNPGQPAERLVEYVPEAPKGTRTTIEWAAQASAARALDGVRNPAAIVAVRPSTGEILAVADRLGGRKAFEQKYAPGSTFKTVTAAALLDAGMSTETVVDCPAAYTIPGGRSIANYRDEAHGSVTLREAYALSCNTTFARMAVERLSPAALMEQARAFGFGVPLPSGVGGTCGSMRQPENDDALAEDSFGQGTVEATPLCMALVAATVESGQWRPPLLMPAAGADRPGSVRLPSGVAAGLRTLMNAVTADGTAAGAGLPDGVAGKTGTAEDWQGGADHAWFIGYWGDLAFAVFVEHGGTGRDAAVPIAARFLKAL
ncbi:penicillin-binding transpeptidase domain-containing protein [Planotetraspora kaengkrachanensis]|uniref:penicillin-binding transpeptidase domain-containing protein n=1 Tax=Planotetraspora kaengkrachanensis TaxID=575193 RepID=UPI001943F0E9|nr:penicillin-binding transpeptidase domain-containing protein [Planotetraspora kaengkrachanensis]